MDSFKSRWSSFWTKHDPDTIFAYNSFKMVTIQDRYLGFLHHSLQIGILIYIIVYVIFIQKEFLKTEDAAGIVRLSIKEGQGRVLDPGVESYCYTDSSNQNGRPPCTFPPVDQLANGDGPNLFISSYINRTDYTAPCDTFLPDCTSTVVLNTEYFVGNLLSVSLSIDHAVQVDYGDKAPYGELQTLSSSSDTSSWKKCKDCAVNEFEAFAADNIPLSVLLKAAKVDLNAIANKYLERTPDYTGPLTYREFGAVILLSVEYDNSENYFSKDPPIIYRYRPLLISDVDDYYFDTLFTSFPNNRTVFERRGLRIVSVISGSLGHFTFQSLLIQLTTSLALMKVATTVVDLIAINLLPDRVLYKNAKFEKTEDFSNLKDQRKRSKQDITMDETASNP